MVLSLAFFSIILMCCSFVFIRFSFTLIHFDGFSDTLRKAIYTERTCNKNIEIAKVLLRFSQKQKKKFDGEKVGDV